MCLASGLPPVGANSRHYFHYRDKNQFDLVRSANKRLLFQSKASYSHLLVKRYTILSWWDVWQLTYIWVFLPSDLLFWFTLPASCSPFRGSSRTNKQCVYAPVSPLPAGSYSPFLGNSYLQKHSVFALETILPTSSYSPFPSSSSKRKQSETSRSSILDRFIRYLDNFIRTFALKDYRPSERSDTGSCRAKSENLLPKDPKIQVLFIHHLKDHIVIMGSNVEG